ncbi:MAG: Fic family protein, partial [Candidatus Hydrothermota bacterium]
MRNSLLEKRKHILESLGGLPGVDVKNREWLYILGEETRYSIMIEGTFV